MTQKCHCNCQSPRTLYLRAELITFWGRTLKLNLTRANDRKIREETPVGVFGTAAPGYNASANRLLDRLRSCLSRHRLRDIAVTRSKHSGLRGGPVRPDQPDAGPDAGRQKTERSSQRLEPGVF